MSTSQEARWATESATLPMSRRAVLPRSPAPTTMSRASSSAATSARTSAGSPRPSRSRTSSPRSRRPCAAAWSAAASAAWSVGRKRWAATTSIAAPDRCASSAAASKAAVACSEPSVPTTMRLRRGVPGSPRRRGHRASIKVRAGCSVPAANCASSDRHRLAAAPAGQLDAELHLASVRAACRPSQPLEQRDGLDVRREDRRLEAAHALLGRTLRQRVEQQPADPAPLPVVGDHDGRLGDVGARPHVPGDADAVPRHGVDGDERLVVAVVDAREVVEVAVAEPRHRPEEPAVARLGAQPLEALGQGRPVLGLDRPDVDLRAVAQGLGHDAARGPGAPRRAAPAAARAGGRDERERTSATGVLTPRTVSPRAHLLHAASGPVSVGSRPVRRGREEHDVGREQRATHRRRTAVVLAAAAVAAVTAAVGAPSAGASVPVRFERIAGYVAPGTPKRLDRVGILKTGRAGARNVLVLNPGTSASAAYFEPLAKSIVERSPNWQVWAVERRENLLEDQSVLDRVKAGKATPTQAFDYYLGWLSDPSITTHFQLIPDAAVAYAKQWGMQTEIQDLRRVVREASRHGRRVVVGGHSLGGSITTAYATWDFGGKAGAKGLAGLVYIDGGSSPTPVTPADATASPSRSRPARPGWSSAGSRRRTPASSTPRGRSASSWTPTRPRSASSSRCCRRTSSRPSRRRTSGSTATPWTPRRRRRGSSPRRPTSATWPRPARRGAGTRRARSRRSERYAKMFAGWGLKGLDGTAWYHPRRLTIDAGAVAAGNANPAQQVLDVHATHGADLPRGLKIYAFGAALGGQRVLDAAKALAAQSRIPARNLTLVDRQATYAHNDPAGASPSRNEFLAALVPYLRQVAHR